MDNKTVVIAGSAVAITSCMFLAGFGVYSFSQRTSNQPTVEQLVSAQLTAMPTAIVLPTVIPTTIPTRVPPTAVPGIDRYVYGEKIQGLLLDFSTATNDFTNLTDGATAYDLLDEAWKQRALERFDKIVDITFDLANEPCPPEYDTVKMYFGKIYKEYSDAREDFYDGIEYVDADSLNRSTAHVQKAVEYINLAKSALPN